MTVSLKHAFESAKADSGDATLIQPSNWNAEHAITMATNRLLGRTTASAGAIEEISVGSGLSLSGGSLSASGGGLPLQLPIQDGRYYSSPLGGAVVSNGLGGAGALDTIWAIPVLFTHDITWTRIGIGVDTLDASGNARLGIYADSNGYPGALVLDAGQVSCAVADEVEATISRALSANTWYWLAIAFDGSDALISGVTTVDSPLATYILGAEDYFQIQAQGSIPFATHTYGALPASFPAADGFETTAPHIWLRKGV